PHPNAHVEAMNNFSPLPATGTRQNRRSMGVDHNGIRTPGERDGAMPMPVAGAPRPFGPYPTGAGAYGPLPRSPPKNKNTQHVPCKFFLQGGCQAGAACPFSHDLESTTRPAPCKYFAKGGCKFGRKCALLHITPD
ncbi:hypothetical protein BAUCODRAFT_47434, partial [Baudoinia panamericana UAMH 10762]